MRLSAFLTFLAIWLVGSAAINLSGNWDGPNGLLLTIEQNPQTGNIRIEYCGIYRVDDWHVESSLTNNKLTFTSVGGNSDSYISGTFTVNSSNKMTGTLTVCTDDPYYNFKGKTSLIKSGSISAETKLFDMGGATYKYTGAEDGLELYFAPGPTHRVDGSMWAQDEVELSGHYEINGLEVSINLNNAYIGSNGQLLGTFSQDMTTLSIHNYSDNPYLPSTITMKLKK